MKVISKEKSDDPKQKDAYLIKLENEEEFLITDEDYFSKQIYGMDDIEPAVLMAFSRNLLVKKAKAYAIKFVILKIRSSGEVRSKLASQGFAEDVIESTIAYLLESNYLNDENYARAYSSHLLKTKRLSMNQIKYELKRKGISSETIEDLFAESETSDVDTARDAFQRKYKNFDYSDVKQKTKAQHFLMSKGFSYDIIKQVITDD